MKKAYIHFAILFAIAAGIMFAVLGSATWVRNVQSVSQAVHQILGQVEQLYAQQQENYATALNLIRDDYINRTQAIAFVVTRDKMFSSTVNMQKFRDVMGVDKINVIDSDGIIRLSSMDNVVGIDLRDFSNAAELLSLAQGTYEGDWLMSLGEVNSEGKRIADYVAIPISDSKYTAVEITFQSSEVDEIRRTTDIRYIVETFLTEYRTTVAAFGLDGQMLGITANNSQTLDIPGVDSPEAMLAFLQRAAQGRNVKVNGASNYVLARKYEDFYLCVCYDMSTVTAALTGNMLGIGILLCLVMLIVLFMLWRFFQKYLLRDLQRMQEDINAFLRGEEGRSIRPCDNPELEPLRHALSAVRQGYWNQSERLNKIIGGTGTGIAVFECLGYTNSLYSSDNLQSLLSLDDEQFHSLKSSFTTFVAFMEELAKKADGEGVFPYNDRWLKLKAYRLEYEYFGLLEDKTAEHEQKILELREAYRDPLTGLYGRAWFERKMRSVLNSPETREGVLLLMDIDNFKAINDNYGHPEGDRALQIMAECLRVVFRRGDILGRLGGDEFVVYMPNPVPRDVMEQKLVSIMELTQQRFANYAHLHVALSVGVAFSNETLSTYEALYEGADTALYIAKETGKNRFYVNEENIRCMRRECIHCRQDCPRRIALGL